MRLIDILNKIANGELKEGARVIWDFKEYIYDGQHELWRNQGRCHYDILEEICLGNLSEEVELIEPHQFREDTKISEPTDNTKIEELDGYEANLMHIFFKLNEVIRIINKRVLDKED